MTPPFFPAKQVIAARFPIQESSPFIYFCYVAHWRRLLIKAISTASLTLKQSQQARQAWHDMTACKKWLAER